LNVVVRQGHEVTTAVFGDRAGIRVRAAKTYREKT